MKISHQPPHQIAFGIAVDFSFAIAVTLSDSEISSPSRRKKLRVRSSRFSTFLMQLTHLLLPADD
jgi:hypothetical protein